MRQLCDNKATEPTHYHQEQMMSQLTLQQQFEMQQHMTKYEADDMKRQAVEMVDRLRRMADQIELQMQEVKGGAAGNVASSIVNDLMWMQGNMDLGGLVARAVKADASH